MKRAAVIRAALLAGLATGCGGAPSGDRGREAGVPVAVPDAPPVGYVGADAGDGHRPLRFADGQVSLNDQCPVRKRGLNLRMPPVFVNGAPIGFC